MRVTLLCLQDDPNLLWLVAACCTVASTLTFLGVYGYWRFWPNRRHQRRVRDMTALRDLLVHHADDLDEILAKLRNKSGAGLPLELLCIFLLRLLRILGCRAAAGSVRAQNVLLQVNAETS